LNGAVRLDLWLTARRERGHTGRHEYQEDHRPRRVRQAGGNLELARAAGPGGAPDEESGRRRVADGCRVGAEYRFRAPRGAARAATTSSGSGLSRRRPRRFGFKSNGLPYLNADVATEPSAGQLFTVDEPVTAWPEFSEGTARHREKNDRSLLQLRPASFWAPCSAADKGFWISGRCTVLSLAYQFRPEHQPEQIETESILSELPISPTDPQAFRCVRRAELRTSRTPSA